MVHGTGFVLVAMVLASVCVMSFSFLAHYSSQLKAARISFGEIIRERMRPNKSTLS